MIKKFLTTIAFLVVIFSSYAQKEGQERIDSLLLDLPRAKEDTIKVLLLQDLSKQYVDIDNQNSINYAKEALALAQKIKWKKGVAYSYIAFGNIYIGDQAMEYNHDALKIFEEIGDQNGIAMAYASLGTDCLDKRAYSFALEYFQKSLSIYEVIQNRRGMARNIGNMGLIYQAENNFNKALECFFRAFKISEELGIKTYQTFNLSSISRVYFNQHEYNKSIEYCNLCLKLYKELQQEYAMPGLINLIGANYFWLHDYRKALEYYFSGLTVSKSLNDKNVIATTQGNIGWAYLEIAKDSNTFLLDSMFGGNKIRALLVARTYIDSANIILENPKQWWGLRYTYKNLSEIAELLGDYKNSLLYHKKYIVAQDSANEKKEIDELLQKEMQIEFDKKHRTDSLIHVSENHFNEVKLQRQYAFTIIGFIGVIVVGIFLFFVFKQRNTIAKEKKRSDDLLLNILPEDVAEELKQKGSAEAKQFDRVTVMFTDFKDFTKISERLTPKELVHEINTFFVAFDEIVSKNRIEKIKTIGDSYMCAGGLPVANETNAIDMVNAALEIQSFMKAHAARQLKDGKEVFEIRIGIHTGYVVAGIVGVKKYAYDIWGDTVNIASRMESSGVVGQVNISGTTYDLVKDKFDCSYRGKIDAKNKGLIDMYFVNHKFDIQVLS